MDRGNSKHGPRLDEQLDHEVRGYVQGGPGAGRVEEWRDPEPSGEDQFDAGSFPDTGAMRPGGAPGTLTADEAERRSRFGTFLPRSVFPAGPEELRRAADVHHAPDGVLELLQRLPERQYRTVAEVWAALGGGVETQRW